jgi:hypothetical protein
LRASLDPIPGQAGENLSHGAYVGGADKGEAAADEGGKDEEQRGDGDAKRNAEDDQEACDEADLALECPARGGAADGGIAGLDPGAGSAFEYDEVFSVVLEQLRGEVRAGSGLADKDNGSVVGQISSAEFDLFKRYVTRSRAPESFHS